MKIVFYKIAVLVCMLIVSGCSSSGVDSSSRVNGFYGRLAPAKDSSPLPVEIAKDIEKISEDGMMLSHNTETVQRGIASITQGLEKQGVHGAHQGGCMHVKIENFHEGGSPKNVVMGHHHHSPNEIRGKALRRVASYRNKRADLSSIGSGEGPLMRAKHGIGPLKRYGTPEDYVGGETVSYIVKLGDTLMKIAFEKYANYLRWKEIYHVNKNKMESPRKMQVGTELTIENVKYVYIKKEGKPYLIRKEDTLRSISKKLYGTPDRWKEIWKNNPQLVKNPKKIYAGFTLYYNPKKGEDPVLMRQPTSKSKKK